MPPTGRAGMRRAEEDIPMDKKNKAVVTVVGNDDRIELWAGEIWNEEQDKLDPASIAESLIEAGL